MSNLKHVVARVLFAFALVLAACRGEPDFAREREDMVRETIEARGVQNARVLAAMRKVPRHAFVPPPFKRRAYADQPLPIGSGQTISQPYIVALMTEAVRPEPSDRCLEIGTGSGYQAAVLAELCAKVFSIEYIPELAELGKRQLRAAGYGPERVELFTGDGYQGWPEEAPFQVIVVTAAPARVPQPLQDQLAVGGRMVVPVGPDDSTQRLELWTRTQSGRGDAAFEVRELADVRFVPFLGEGARRRCRKLAPWPATFSSDLRLPQRRSRRPAHRPRLHRPRRRASKWKSPPRRRSASASS